MIQNGQTHFKNLAANAGRFLKCLWPFWGIMHERVKLYFDWNWKWIISHIFMVSTTIYDSVPNDSPKIKLKLLLYRADFEHIHHNTQHIKPFSANAPYLYP